MINFRKILQYFCCCNKKSNKNSRQEGSINLAYAMKYDLHHRLNSHRSDVSIEIDYEIERNNESDSVYSTAGYITEIL